MSPRTHKEASGPVHEQRRRPSARAASTRVPHVSILRHGLSHTAPLFAALGDPTRLSLLAKLSRGQAYSISQLAHGSHLTRQAITKHLRVLERAKIVRSVRSGRHALFELDPQPVHELRDYLDRISAQWDETLSRLKSFVEDAHPH
jgi:DNA-binding transcriptional ArsR family regulator